MKKLTVVLAVFTACFCATFIVSPRPAGSEVNVSVGVGINVPPPPRYVFPAPPPVYPIPGLYVYFPLDATIDIFFYQGRWYRPHNNYWFYATSYNGPWRHIVVEKVPRVLIDIPPGYRSVPPGHQRIPYGQAKKYWRQWEKDKYWDKHDRWEEKRGRDRRRTSHPGPDDDRRGGHGRGSDDDHRGGGRGHGQGKH